MATSVIDLFLVYSLLKRLVTPFEKWDAFKAGVIDKNGNILVKPNFRTSVQSRSFKTFDVMVRNMKMLLGKIPGGKSMFASFAASLFLLKEQSDEVSEDRFLSFLKEESCKDLYAQFIQEYPQASLQEDAPVNNVGGGAIAGMNGDGPTTLSKTPIKRRKLATHRYAKYLRMNR